jgi:hypothetical protein
MFRWLLSSSRALDERSRLEAILAVGLKERVDFQRQRRPDDWDI